MRTTRHNAEQNEKQPQTFEVKGGSLVIGDPSYSRENLLKGGILDKSAANGTWTAVADARYVDEFWGWRVLTLTAIHESAECVQETDWTLLTKTVWVDTGQCGIFDSAIYPDDPRREDDSRPLTQNSAENMNKKSPSHKSYHGGSLDEGTLYDTACKLTQNHGWGAMKGGVVSISGWGDGTYTAFGRFNQSGELVAVKMNF